MISHRLIYCVIGLVPFAWPAFCVSRFASFRPLPLRVVLFVLQYVSCVVSFAFQLVSSAHLRVGASLTVRLPSLVRLSRCRRSAYLFHYRRSADVVSLSALCVFHFVSSTCTFVLFRLCALSSRFDIVACRVFFQRCRIRNGYYKNKLFNQSTTLRVAVVKASCIVIIVGLGLVLVILGLDAPVTTWCHEHQSSMGILLQFHRRRSRRNRRKDRGLARIVLEPSCSLAVILRIRHRKHHRHQHQTRQVVFVSRALDLLVGLLHIIAIKTRQSKHVIIHLGVIEIMCSLDLGVVESSCIVDHRCTYLSSFGCIVSVSVD